MKTKLFILFTSIICLNTYAQRNPAIVEHIITTDALFATSVYAAYINGDGFIDVLSSSDGDNTIAWYENTDGLGNFVEHIITNTALRAFSVHAEDINGDGFMDVLSASWDDNTIAWYENVNGDGSVWIENIIVSDLFQARVVYAADINGNGDMDVLCGSWGSELLIWYENVNGNGSAWIENIIVSGLGVIPSVYAADFNGDGFIDVLSAFIAAIPTIAWYENDGNGIFTEHPIAQGAEVAGLAYVHAADINGDGFIDVLFASENDKIAWYENTDGQGSFGPQQIISTTADRPVGLYATDMDGDGNVDVLSASINDNKILLYKNTAGQGNSWVEELITQNAQFAVDVYAANININVNGSIDALSASVLDNKIAWYDRLLSVNENTLVDFSVYPNPTTGILTIQSKTNIVQIEIYNQLGQLVLSNNEENTIDISNVGQGLYFIKILDENGNIGTQKVVKK